MMDLEESIWCDRDLDDIARAPLAPVGPMTFDDVHAVCSYAVKAALVAVRLGRLEDALPELLEHVRGLEPVDPSSSTVDAWSRLGAMAGAEDMWRQACPRHPKDCPSPVHALHYCYAWVVAATCVAWAAGPTLARGVR